MKLATVLALALFAVALALIVATTSVQPGWPAWVRVVVGAFVGAVSTVLAGVSGRLLRPVLGPRIREIVAALRRRWSPIEPPDPTLAMYQHRRTLQERDDFEIELSAPPAARRRRGRR